MHSTQTVVQDREWGGRYNVHRHMIVCCRCEAETPSSIEYSDWMASSANVMASRAAADGFTTVVEGVMWRNYCQGCWERKKSTLQDHKDYDIVYNGKPMEPELCEIYPSVEVAIAHDIPEPLEISDHPYPQSFAPRQEWHQRQRNQETLISKPIKSRYFDGFEKALNDADLYTVEKTLGKKMTSTKDVKNRVVVFRKG